MKFANEGIASGQLFALMDEVRKKDADWKGGKTFGYIYHAGDEVNEVVETATAKFLHTNALSLTAFPSLKRFESELVGMASELLHAPEPAGSVTSGGTESIMMAVKAAREWAKQEKPDVREPELVAPISAHPAFEKACAYFGVRAVRTPVAADLRADMAALAAAITPNTIMVVGSAPGFPHGVIDPIPEIAALAQQHKLLCHVDACLGGYILPFLEQIGHPVPPFDFRVEGVTSMSADLHKYGYAAKGASTVLYRSRALRRFQHFAYVDWPGGIYASPAALGARGGASIASAWAVLKHLGRAGYGRLAGEALEATRQILAGIRAIPGLAIMGEPAMTVFAFRSDSVNAYALGDAMEKRGWILDKLQHPTALHMMVSPRHLEVVPQFLADLRACTEEVRGLPPPQTGAAAVYGMLASLPDRKMVAGAVLDFMDGWTDPQ